MSQTRRILFAIKDPASRRHATLDKVARLAKELGASLELFTALTAPLFLELAPMTSQSLDDMQRDALDLRRRQLEKLAARARKLGVTTQVAVEWDSPAHEAIARRARGMRADLVVAECHRGRRLAPWLLHLTDWELLRESPARVLLLKNARPWRRPTVLAAVDPSHAHAKPARLDAAIIAQASAVTRRLRGRLEVMHCDHPSLLGFTSGDPAMDAVALQISYAAQQRADRDEFEKFAQRHRVPLARRHLLEGAPAFGIPRLARKLGADVVVMGAISRSGLKRVFIGGTAERVLESLRCDVLVVKQPRAEKAVARKPRGPQVVSQPLLLSLPA